MALPLEARPRVSDRWRLRNDGRYLVAYRCSVLQHRFTVLPPAVALLAPLLDGSRTCTELGELAVRMFGIPGDGSDARLRTGTFDALEALSGPSGFLRLDGEVSPSLRSDPAAVPERWLPSLVDYEQSPDRLARPLSVMIAFTNRCACDCLYCYAERRRVPERRIDAWRGVFDELAREEVYLVDIAGGDPFLHPDAFEILEEMVARDFTFFVSTKRELTREQARRLAGLGIGRDDLPPYLRRKVQVSIDSDDPAVAARLVRHPGYLEKATRTVDRLLAAGIKPRVKGVLTSLNPEAPEGVVRHFAERGVEEFDFVQYTRSHYRHDDALFMTDEEKRRLREAAERVREDFPDLQITVQDETTRSLRLDWDQWHRRAVCSGGRSNMIVQPNGDVTLCDQTPHAPPFVMGNLFDEGVMGVWRSERIPTFLYPPRERFAGTVCSDCPELDACHRERGRCYRDALFYFGSIHDAPPECPRQLATPLRKT